MSEQLPAPVLRPPPRSECELSTGAAPGWASGPTPLALEVRGAGSGGEANGTRGALDPGTALSVTVFVTLCGSLALYRSEIEELVSRIERAGVTMTACGGHTVHEVGEPPVNARPVHGRDE